MQIGSQMSTTNKIKCATEQMGNNLKTNLAGAAVGAAGGAAIGTAILNPNGKIANFCTKLADKILNSKLGQKAVNLGQKAVHYLKANPKIAKTIGIVAVPLIAIGSLLGYKQAHNNGKIQQKYEDKDNFEKAVK